MKKLILTCALLSALLLAAAGCGERLVLPTSDPDTFPAQTQTEPATSEADAELEAEEKPIFESIDLFAHSGISTFELTSADLHDGVWANIVSNTANGSNLSPQLSWDAVDGAGLYVVYMIDTFGDPWMHWLSPEVTETNLPRGWASADEYIGPYPPSGSTHGYDVYVFALRQPVERVKGSLNSPNLKFVKNALDLDIAADGSTGNILAYGRLAGTYTSGE